jgi:hypothetical protein
MVDMMTPEEVKHIALLARLGLSDEAVAKYGKDLATVLAWFEQLSKRMSRVSAIGHIYRRCCENGRGWCRQLLKCGGIVIFRNRRVGI